ncbi:hypothetical protein [Kaarinaea lacus]
MKIEKLFESGLRGLVLLVIGTVGLLTIIGSNGGGGGGPSTGTVSITSPYDASGLPDTGTLEVSVFVDGSSTAAISRTIDTLSASVTIDVQVAAGTHTFSIVFEYTDPVFAGPYQVGAATSAGIDVIAGSTHPYVFIDTDFSYQDFDSDGLTNLAEMHSSMRTNPADSKCILDKSILDGCTLG